MTAQLLMQSLGLLTAIAVMLRVLLGQLRTEFKGEVGRLDARIDGLTATFDARLTAIESDLSLIKGHLIGKRATG